MAKKQIVIIGGGFAGLHVAKGLKRADADVTLIDRNNYHLFQPLLYQVATGVLSPANISVPLRTCLKRQQNTRVLQGNVVGFDVSGKTIELDGGDRIAYDILVVAAGAKNFFFNNAEFERQAPGLKSLDDATTIRSRVLSAFEEAERNPDPANIKGLLTFVVVGGGPTGLELSGAIIGLAKQTMKGEFRNIDPTQARVVLVEGHDRLLPPFPEKLSIQARKQIESLGVSVRTSSRLQEITPTTVKVQCGDKTETIEARNVFWGAGVAPSPLGKLLAEQTDAEVDRAGHVAVNADCSLKNHPDIFVLGDLASFDHDENGLLPGTGAVASQQGTYLGVELTRRLAGREPRNFKYCNRGSMATIGRRAAVVNLGRFQFSGYFAWLTWLFLHLILLVGFENRLLVLIQWFTSYITRYRAARLITHTSIQPADANKIDTNPHAS